MILELGNVRLPPSAHNRKRSPTPSPMIVTFPAPCSFVSAALISPAENVQALVGWSAICGVAFSVIDFPWDTISNDFIWFEALNAC